MDSYDDTSVEGVNSDTGAEPGTDSVQPAESELALVRRVQKTIREDKNHHEPAFKRMREDMFMARNGRDSTWDASNYKVNLAGRHVRQKTAALYAKNPKATARRRESLDFQVWDEDPKSLEMAMQTAMMAQQMLAAAPPTLDPLTGAPAAPQVPDEMLAALQKANEIIADFQQGTARRAETQKIGKTLEILFSYSMREQKPVDFKTSMKAGVRRATTTGVMYAELGFQREMGPRPVTMEKLADARARLDHLRVLTEKIGEGRIEADDPEIAELEHTIATLQAEPEIVIREGLIVDFPQSTRVIPDKLTKMLVGFVGSRHVTLEYLYTVDQVREIFGVDLGKNYRGYTAVKTDRSKVDETIESAYTRTSGKGSGLVCVWKHYEKVTGLVYYTADGYDKWLREPAAPDVFVEDFWPVYALTFNDVESEDELFPPSDVRLMADQQMEYNRSRQGLRDHRWAARPRWGVANGAIEDEDVAGLSRMAPFDVKTFNLAQGQKIGDTMEAIPVPGVDPNLYETNPLFYDIQLITGAGESQFGLTGKATATGEAIAAGATKSTDDSSIDDLDAFLTVIARSSGQILLREMSEEQVKQIVGIGAVWPQQTLAEIAGEITLEIEAGSTGKPNQAVEIQNWERMLPYLVQMPGVSPVWIARETIRRLDDKADLTEALAADMPSIMAQNGLAQVSTGNPATDPNAQGPQGADNAPTPESQAPGTGPAFGDNKI